MNHDIALEEIKMEQEAQQHEAGEKQVFVANIVKEDLSHWSKSVTDHVEDITGQYLYSMGKDRRFLEYAGCEVSFKEGVNEILREHLLDKIEESLADVGNLHYLESAITSGGRIVSVEHVADAEDRQRHFDETLDHLQGNPIIFEMELVQVRGGLRPIPPGGNGYGVVTTITKDRHTKEMTLVGVDIGDGKGEVFVYETQRDRRRFDAPMLGDVVHMQRSDRSQELRLEKVNPEDLERLSDQPGKYTVTPIGAVDDRSVVVRHAGRDKVVDTANHREADFALRQSLYKPVEIQMDRDGQMLVKASEVQKGREESKGLGV